MKSVILTVLACFASVMAGVYQVGEVVTDLQFQDTNLDNGHVAVYNRSVYDLINQKKLLLINFFQPS